MARAPKLQMDTQETPLASPSEQIIKDGIQPKVLIDGRGRKLTVRRPGVLAQFRMTEALGDLALNQAYAQMTMPLIYLADIDGEPVFPPKNKAQIEGLISQLDHEGLTALNVWYIETVVGPAMAAIDEAERKASLKN